MDPEALGKRLDRHIDNHPFRKSEANDQVQQRLVRRRGCRYGTPPPQHSYHRNMHGLAKRHLRSDWVKLSATSQERIVPPFRGGWSSVCRGHRSRQARRKNSMTRRV